MDITTLLAFFLLLLLPFLFLRKSSFPPLPGPSPRDYLPGGSVFPLFRDPTTLSKVLRHLNSSHGRIFQLWLGPQRAIISAHRDDVTQLMSNVSDFGRPPAQVAAFSALAPGGLLSSAGAGHKAARRTLRGRFHHGLLASYHRYVSRATMDLCNSLSHVAGKGGIDILDYLYETALRIVTTVTLGGALDRQQYLSFGAATNVLLEELQKEFIGYPARQWLTFTGLRHKFLQTGREIRRECLPFIAKRLAETRHQKDSREEDILDAILEISQGDEAKAVALTIEFAVAGSHTTAYSLVWAMFHLCCNQNVTGKLVAEVDAVAGDRPLSEQLTLDDVQKLGYTMQVWKETLRRRPIGASSARVATKDVTLRGTAVRVPKGTLVLPLFSACQMDPSVWKDPTAFRPERWDNEPNAEWRVAPPGSYLPFGIGQMACAGQFLANYEAPLILGELYRRFSFELDCEPDEIYTSSSFVERAKCSRGDGDLTLPVKVRMRMQSE